MSTAKLVSRHRACPAASSVHEECWLWVVPPQGWRWLRPAALRRPPRSQVARPPASRGWDSCCRTSGTPLPSWWSSPRRPSRPVQPCMGQWPLAALAAQQLQLYDLPKQPPPIYVAAGGPKSASLPGQYGNGWDHHRQQRQSTAAGRIRRQRPRRRQGSRAHADLPGVLRRLRQLWALAAVPTVARSRVDIVRAAPRCSRCLATPSKVPCCAAPPPSSCSRHRLRHILPPTVSRRAGSTWCRSGSWAGLAPPPANPCVWVSTRQALPVPVNPRRRDRGPAYHRCTVDSRCAASDDPCL